MKMGLEIGMFGSEIGTAFEKLGSTPPPKIQWITPPPPPDRNMFKYVSQF